MNFSNEAIQAALAIYGPIAWMTIGFAIGIWMGLTIRIVSGKSEPPEWVKKLLR